MEKIDQLFYNNYVCPYCFQQIPFCSCENFPPWELIHIDEGIQKAVRLLNQKGYKTKFCCEGHFNRSFRVYISFVKNYVFDNIPNGFSYSKQILFYNLKPNQDYAIFEENRKRQLSILEKWAESLQNIKGG